jgi:predicted nucleotide-binding protein
MPSDPGRVRDAIAKVAGLQSAVRMHIAAPPAQPHRVPLYFDPAAVIEYFEAYEKQATVLRDALPNLFGDLPVRGLPRASGTGDNDGRGYIERSQLERLLRDIEYLFEVRSHSELSVPASGDPREQRVFISHGQTLDWREVQIFIEKDLGIETLELAQEPNFGRTVLQKLAEESARCSYAIIVMTGEDTMADGQVRARENVIHEIGYFQGKFGLSSICLLHEEGVNTPSNIHGLVYIPFPPGIVRASFSALARELRAAWRS